MALKGIDSMVALRNSGMVMMTTSLMCSSVILLVLWRRYWGAERKRKSTYKGKVLLPSPQRLLPKCFGSLSGHTLLLEQEKLGKQLEAWAEEFKGDYELRVLGKRAIVVVDPVDIRRILSLRPSGFRRGTTADQADFAGRELGMSPSLVFNEGQMWGRSRRIISPLLSPHKVLDMLPTMTAIVERLCARWSEDAKAGRVVDAKNSMLRYAHDILFRSAMGVDPRSLDVRQGEPSPTFDAIQDVTAALLRLTIDPASMFVWSYVPWLLAWSRRTKRYLAVLEYAALDAIRQTQRRLHGKELGGKGNGEERDVSPEVSKGDGEILEKILSLRIDNDGGAAGGGTGAVKDRMGLPDEHIMAEIRTLFVAGTETTAMTLSWALYYLAKHPGAAARCRREALEVAPETKGVVSTKEQLMRLVFCSAVFKETLRLRPVLPIIFLNSIAEYEMQSGVIAEEDTPFMLLVRPPVLSEDAFTRAREFVPERWIDSERDAALLGEGSVAEGVKVRHAVDRMAIYGGGPRTCPGKGMAKAEGAMLLAAVCARFNVVLAPGQRDPPEEVQTAVSSPERVELVLTEN